MINKKKNVIDDALVSPDGELKDTKKKKGSKKNQELKPEKKEQSVYINDEKRLYELTVILSPELTEKNRTEKIESIKKLITGEGSEIILEDCTMGLRKFCYKIKSSWNGFFVIYSFSAKASSILELSSTLRIDLDVLRYLIVKLPENYIPQTYEQLKEKYEVKAEQDNIVKTYKNKPLEHNHNDKVAPIIKAQTVTVSTTEQNIEKIEDIKEEVIKNIDIKITEMEESTKPEIKTEISKETSDSDHLKELDDKLNKLLLSDDI